jgi:hypothetical protein
MDHIFNDGNKERSAGQPSGSGFYSLLKKQGFPTRYQILCWNCNASYACCGYCPHQRERTDAA